MPQTLGRPAPFRPSKDLQITVDSFNGGWNTFSRPTELKDNELAQADNLMLTGVGVPTQRWGSVYFNLVGSGRIRLLAGHYNTVASINQLLSISDAGYLVKKTNASYTMITGASFASGLSYQSAELGNTTYISSATLPFVKYDGTNLIPYLALSTPSLTTLSVLSAASGLNTYSWRITALSPTGETLGSPAKTLASLSTYLFLDSAKLVWNAVSAASGMLKGYNIYRGNPGNERYVATVGPTTTEFQDVNSVPSNVISLPNADTTAGIRAKFILKFDDRLVVAGVAGEPSKVYISARYPFQDCFTAIDGGGWALVSPDDGDEIVGLGTAGNQGMTTSSNSGFPPSSVLVFKKNSVHRMAIGFTDIGNYRVVDCVTQLLTASNGCSSGDTIVPVENDTFYFGKRGIFTVGQEPTFLNQIRTNELSARIRPYIESLSPVDFTEACGGYLNNKYFLAFPTRKETIIYDRERMCFMGPWKTPFGITKWFEYQDSDGVMHYLAGTDTGANYEFGSSYVSDNGTAIAKLGRTKKFDFGAWSIMKIIKMFYVLFRSVRGQVNVNIMIETRSGATTVTKSFTLTSAEGTSGWGSELWGDVLYGDTDGTIVLTGEELARFGQLYKQCRVVQVEFSADTANSQFEFLGLRMTGQGLGDTSLPSSQRA